MEKTAAKLPTKHGSFTAYAFKINGIEHFALVKGNVKGKKAVLTRVHSSCLTGDVFHSLRCDCRAQLEKALREIGKTQEGIIVYLNQEGRGIGLYNKIRAYALQEQGLDTYQANVKLGFKADLRKYADAAAMLDSLEVGSINLLSNNPEKAKSLKRHGIKVEKTLPLKTKPNKFNKNYLQTKKRFGHQL